MLSVFEILEREDILFVLLGLGERILREEKEMREMKRRLLAIEADLQALYRENEEESTEVSLLTLSITHVSSRSNCCLRVVTLPKTLGPNKESPCRNNPYVIRLLFAINVMTRLFAATRNVLSALFVKTRPTLSVLEL